MDLRLRVTLQVPERHKGKAGQLRLIATHPYSPEPEGPGIVSIPSLSILR